METNKQIKCIREVVLRRSSIPEGVLAEHALDAYNYCMKKALELMDLLLFTSEGEMAPLK